MKKSEKMKNNGSILVFTLIILFLTVISAIGVANVTILERRGAFSTGSSVSAFQIADSGAEIALKKIVKDKYIILDDLINLGNLGSEPCIVYKGVAIVTDSVTFPGKKIQYSFTKKVNGLEVPIDSCSDTMNPIYKVRSTGSYSGSSRAIQITIKPKIIDVAAGYDHILYLDSTGIVRGAGANMYGQLGQGSVGSDEEYPIAILDSAGTGLLTNIVSIAAGQNHSVAVDDSGRVWTWGRNNTGQLGNCNEGVDSASPVRVRKDDCSGIAENLNVGGDLIQKVNSGINYSFAIDSAGNVWSWGFIDNNRLGRSTSIIPGDAAGQVTGISNIVKINGGDGHSIAMDEDGILWAWGYNWDGQLGNGKSVECQFEGDCNHYGDTLEIYKLQKDVDGNDLPHFSDFSTGSDHSLAVDVSGNIWAWGLNVNKPLGHEILSAGGEDRSPWPRNITAIQIADYGSTPLQNIVSVEGGWTSSFAINTDGVAWGWGWQRYSTLGNSTPCGNPPPPDFLTPTVVACPVKYEDATNVSGFKKISAMYDNAVVFDKSHNAWTWGRNANYELGIGLENERNYAVKPEL